MSRPLLVDQFNRPIQRANAGGYEGAMQARRLNSFVPSRSSTNTLLQRSGESLVVGEHGICEIPRLNRGNTSRADQISSVILGGSWLCYIHRTLSLDKPDK